MIELQYNKAAGMPLYQLHIKVRYVYKRHEMCVKSRRKVLAAGPAPPIAKETNKGVKLMFLRRHSKFFPGIARASSFPGTDRSAATSGGSGNVDGGKIP